MEKALDGQPLSEALVERLLRDAIGMFELLALYLGERLHLYRAMAGSGWMTSTDLSGRTGTNERYVREWLEHQAVSGIVEVDDVAAEPTSRRFRLPADHARVLVDEDSVLYQGHKGVDMVRAARPLAQLVEAFRSGGGLPRLPWEPEGRPEFNRAIFRNLLGRQWLPAIPEVDGRLRSEPAALVADLGCGTGWSSISMALAYPSILVDGFDLDEDAIARAREHAANEGVDDRVRFVAADAASLEGAVRYDLVTVYEALHDMAHPVAALRGARDLLAPGGSVLVADERVGESFSVPADDVERYAYGWSVVSCLPFAMGDPDSAATGTVMRPATLRRYASEAGFGRVDILPIDTDFWRFYRLMP